MGHLNCPVLECFRRNVPNGRVFERELSRADSKLILTDDRRTDRQTTDRRTENLERSLHNRPKGNYSGKVGQLHVSARGEVGLTARFGSTERVNIKNFKKNINSFGLRSAELKILISICKSSIL